jgi:hypothetical protein
MTTTPQSGITHCGSQDTTAGGQDIPAAARQAAFDAAFPGLPAGLNIEEARRRMDAGLAAARPHLVAADLREAAKTMHRGRYNPHFVCAADCPGCELDARADALERTTQPEEQA